MSESKEFGSEDQIRRLVLEQRDDPHHIIGEILIKKGYPIKVTNVYVDNGLHIDKMEGYLNLLMPEDVAKIFDRLVQTPEVKAISQIKGPRTADENFSVEECHWDENTKRRVLALYWENRAKEKKKDARWAKHNRAWSEERYLITDYETQAKQYQSKARDLLGKQRKLKPKRDFRRLLEQVVQSTIDPSD